MPFPWLHCIPPPPRPQVASLAWPEAASSSLYLILLGYPQQVLPLLLPTPAAGPHSFSLSHCPLTLPLRPSWLGLTSDPDPGLTDLLLKLTLISSWQWWFSRSCRHCSLGGGERERMMEIRACGLRSLLSAPPILAFTDPAGPLRS